MAVEAFALHVDLFFRDNYQPGADDPHVDPDPDSDRILHGQYGSTLSEILADELQADTDRVVQAIVACLPDFSEREITRGAERFYDDTVNYELIEEVNRRKAGLSEEYWYENRFYYQWHEFCEFVQYRNRYFKVKEALDDLFGQPADYLGGKVNPIHDLPAGEVVFRARMLDESFTEEKLRAEPVKELGAPPRDRVGPGRMNVEFIAAFYAAFSDITAVAEIRPGIEESVAIGRFRLVRDTRVFDFTVFSDVVAENWRDVYGHTRYDFIRQMEGEISRPLRSSERQRRYIPTQIVAEYLREYFGCEAVIYRSAAVGQGDRSTRNIVFLPREGEFAAGDAPLLELQDFEVIVVAGIQYEIQRPQF